MSAGKLVPSFFCLLTCHPTAFCPSDRVVDDLNPVLNFTRREVESLLHFVDEEPDASQVRLQPRDCLESVLAKALHLYPHLITKVQDKGKGIIIASVCPLVVN